MEKIKLWFDLNHDITSFGIQFKNFANRVLEATIRFYSIRNFGDSIYHNTRFMSKRDAVKILACGSIFCAETEKYVFIIFLCMLRLLRLMAFSQIAVNFVSTVSPSVIRRYCAKGKAPTAKISIQHESLCITLSPHQKRLARVDPSTRNLAPKGPTPFQHAHFPYVWLHGG